MSQENVELVRSAFGMVTIPGDPEAMIAASHPAIERLRAGERGRGR